MKKIVVLSTMMVFLLISCEKEFYEIVSNEAEIPMKSSVTFLESVELSCTSTDSNCKMLFDSKKGTLACDCSDSKMLFQTNNDELRDISIISFYLNYFGNYIKNKHQVSISTITSVEYQLFDKSEVVSVKYMIDGELKSVMYVTSFDKAKGGTVEVDCTGNCDKGSYGECTEVYSTVTGDISCSCSGCKMKLTPLEPNKPVGDN